MRPEETRTIGRAIFLFFRLLLGRDVFWLGGRLQNPFKTSFGTDDGHGLSEFGVGGGVKRGAKELDGVGGEDFLVISLREEGGDGAHFGIGGADFIDARIAGLQQIEKRGGFDFGRILEFEQRVRLVLFWWPELDVDRASDAGVVVVELAQFLLEVEGHQPNFGTIVTNVAGEDELDDGFVSRKSYFGVQVGGDLIQALPNAEADGFEVGGFGVADVGWKVAGVDTIIDGGDGSVKIRKFVVQTGEDDGGSWRKPVDGAEQNAGAKAVELNRDGRVGLNFDGIFDRSDDDGVFDHGDNNATGSQIGDNFLGRGRGGFLGVQGDGANREGNKKGSEYWPEEAEGKIRTHLATLPQVAMGGRWDLKRATAVESSAQYVF